MRKKNNKIIAFSLLALCFACLAFGVYALKNATLTVSGTVGFTAHDCLVNVVAEIEGDGVVAGVPNSHGEPSAKRDLIINKAENSNEMLVGGGTQADWNKTAEIAETIWFTDLTETGAVAEIVMTFTLTNQSAYSVTASIANAEIANVRVGASEEITLEKGAQGVLTATFNLDLNANGEYPEINNLPFEVKLDFRKAGSTGGEEGGDDVVTGDIDFNNLPQSVDEISSQLTNAGFEVNKGDGMIQATKDGYQYMFLQCESEEEAKAMLEELKNDGMPESYKASTNGVIVWVTDNPNIEIETVKLQAPVSATYNQDTNKLNITAVEKASGYIINLYQGENLVSSQTLTNNEEVVSAIYTLDAGTYDVKAIAVGDGMSTSNSDESGVLTQITVVEETYSSVEYMSMMFESMLKVTRDADGNVVSIVGQKEDSENGMLHMISANDVELTKVENGNSTTFTNPENEMQTFTLNKDADGNVTSIGYDAVGAVGLVSRDEENNCTKITLTMGTAAEGDENEIGYVLVADSGLIIKEVLGGEEVTYAYDKNGNVVKTIMGTNGFIHEYDENGNVTYFEMLYSGRLYYSVVAEYNENNKLTMWEMADHNSDGSKNYIMNHVLTYDSNGDLVKEVITDSGNTSEYEIQTINYQSNKPVDGTLMVYSDEGHENLIKKANLKYEYNIDDENPVAYRELTAYLNADDQITEIWINEYYGNGSSSHSIFVNYDSRYGQYLVMSDDYVEGTNYTVMKAVYDEETWTVSSQVNTEYYFENGVLNSTCESTRESITNNGDSSLTETQAVWTYYNEDGSVKSKSVNQYEYYENGKQKKSTTTSYDANDNMTTQSIYEYDESGNLIKRTGYGHAGADIKTYSYRKEIEIYEPNNKERKVLSTTIEIYDEDQNLIASYETEREYVNDGTINFVETKTYYDADGNKMETSVTNYLTSGIQQPIKTLYYNSDSRIKNAFTNNLYVPGSTGYTITEGVVDEENSRQLSSTSSIIYTNTSGEITMKNITENIYDYDDANNSYTLTQQTYSSSASSGNLDNPRLNSKTIYTYVNGVETNRVTERYNTDGSLYMKDTNIYENGKDKSSISETYNSDGSLQNKTEYSYTYFEDGKLNTRTRYDYNSENVITNTETEYYHSNGTIWYIMVESSNGDINYYNANRESITFDQIGERQ